MKHILLFALFTALCSQTAWAEKTLNSNQARVKSQSAAPHAAHADHLSETPDNDDTSNQNKKAAPIAEDDSTKNFIVTSAALGGLAAVAVGGAAGGTAIAHLHKHKQTIKLHHDMLTKLKRLENKGEDRSVEEKHFLDTMKTQNPSKLEKTYGELLKDHIERMNSSKLLSADHALHHILFHENPATKAYKELIRAEKLK